MQKGLRPFEDRRTRGAPNLGRVQQVSPEQLQSPNLRPQATPVDTYARPEEPSRDPSGLLQLAETLGQIQPSILGLADAIYKKRNNPQDSAAAAQEILVTQGVDAVRQQIQSGNAPEAFQNVYGAEVLGIEAGHTAGRELANLLTSGEILPENIEAWWAERSQADISLMPDEHAYKQSYLKTIDRYRQRSLIQMQELAGEQIYEGKRAAAYNAMAGEYELAIQEGMAPAEAAKTYFATFDNNRNLLGLPYKEQQGMALTYAQQLITQGNYDAAQAILEHARDSGPAAGQSLLNHPETSGRANNLLVQIEQVRDKEVRRQASVSSERALDDYLRQTLYTGGSLPAEAQVLGEDGDLKTVTGTQLEKRQQRVFLEESNRIKAERGESQEQTFEREMEMISRASGLKHPQWFDTMERGVVLSNVGTASQPELPPQMKAGFEMYRRLSVVNPNYLRAHLSEKAQTYYESVMLNMSGGVTGVNEDEMLREAHIKALIGMGPDAPPRMDRGSRDYAALNTAADSALNAGVWGLLFGGKTANNRSYIKNRILRHAEQFIRTTGATTEKAVERAAQIVEEQSVVYNGIAFERTANMPKNVENLFDEQVTKFVEKYGEELGVEKDDLAILPYNAGSGVYYIFNPSTGEMFEEARFGGLGTITNADFRALERDRAARDDAERARIAAEQERNQLERQDLLQRAKELQRETAPFLPGGTQDPLEEALRRAERGPNRAVIRPDARIPTAPAPQRERQPTAAELRRRSRDNR